MHMTLRNSVSQYRRVLKELPSASNDLVGRTVRRAITDQNGTVVVPSGRRISKAKAIQINELPNEQMVQVKPFVLGGDAEVIYLSADQDETFRVAQANSA